MKKDEIIKRLKNYFQKPRASEIDMAFLYGSWAYGNPSSKSDIDIAITGSKLDDYKIYDLLNNISLELIDLLKCDVNVIYIDEELSKPMLHYNAIVHGIPVFMKDFQRYVYMRLKAISQMEDFTIFGRKWQDEILKRRLESIKLWLKLGTQKEE